MPGNTAGHHIVQPLLPPWIVPVDARLRAQGFALAR